MNQNQAAQELFVGEPSITFQQTTKVIQVFLCLAL